MSTQTIRQMPPGAGKTEVALKHAISRPELSGMLILHRSEIETGWIPGLQSQLGPEADPQDLSILAGSTIITIEGYIDDDREIYEIPEIRGYFKRQNKIWAPWLFAGTIFTADLFAIVLACLPTITCCRRNGHLHIKWVEEEMLAFLQKSLPAAAVLHSRAGIKKEKGCAQLKAAAAYVGLAFSE